MLQIIFQEQSIFKDKQNPQRSLEQNIHPQLRAIKCKMYSSTGITLLVLLAVAGTTLAMAAGDVTLIRDKKAATEPETNETTAQCPQVQNIHIEAPEGRKGGRGLPGAQGPQGPQGVTAGGATYIRWGRTTCNSSAGTQLLYSGIMAGSFFDDTGGGANHLCLPDEDPEFLNVTDGVQSSRARLYGTEYEAEQNPPNFGAMEEHNVPCAVCYTPTRGTMIMIPAKVICPTSWTREYYGYLMSAQYNTPHRRTMFECVDSDAESVPGSAANTNGAVLYFTEARCNGIACPPYEDGKELACTVCTK